MRQDKLQVRLLFAPALFTTRAVRLSAQPAVRRMRKPRKTSARAGTVPHL